MKIKIGDDASVDSDILPREQRRVFRDFIGKVTQIKGKRVAVANDSGEFWFDAENVQPAPPAE